MPGKPGFRIGPAWTRPDAALLASFGNAASSQVADCMSRLGAMDSGIKPVWASPRIIGPAITVWCHSGDNLMIHKALGLAWPGDIVVVNTQGNIVNAVFGELMATSAVKIGVRAVIVDGVVRDSDAFEKLGIAVYARGVCPNSCHKDGPGEVGTAIACGGVAVHPGDIIVADRDGVAVVPRADAAEVAKLAIAHVAKEEQRIAEIEQGVLIKPEIDEALRRLKVID